MRGRAASAGLVALLVVLTVAGPAWGSQHWTIERYDVLIDVLPDGSMRIAEEIEVVYDEPRRGIYREIPVHYALAYDSDLPLPDPDLGPEDYVRVHQVEDIRVSSSTAPDDVLVTQPGGDEGWLNIRIGDEDTTITGRHTYVITYTVRGGLNAFDSHTELYWNAIGGSWDVPIASASATVTGPGIQGGTCFQGPRGSDRLCDAVRVGTDRASFRAGSLPVGSGLTVVLAFAPEAVDAGAPILRERFDLQRRLWGSDAAVPLAVLVALLAFGGLGVLAYRQGRDRELVGGIAIDGTVTGPIRRRPLFSRLTVPVQFRPPDGLRPGQLGVIVDERVDPVDVTATIVDLAVRGWLRIVEDDSERFLWFTRTEHRLERLEDPEDDQLRRYERRLLNALFEDGDEVTLEELRGDFYSEYVKVRDVMYQDAATQGWFGRTPDKTRARWIGIGVASLVASGLVTFLLISTTRVGIVGLPLAAASFTMILLNRVMPHRTAAGSDALRRALGFREFIVTAEADRMRFAEREHLFLEYLPYAVVFGATDKWAQAFEGLDIETATRGVYVSTSGFDSLDGLSRSISSFSSSVGSGLATSPSSSGGSGFSGGSSGGGGGGGGGGSW